MSDTRIRITHLSTGAGIIYPDATGALDSIFDQAVADKASFKVERMRDGAVIDIEVAKAEIEKSSSEAPEGWGVAP